MKGAAESVDVLVARAAHGDEGAWKAIVDRYASLVWSICLRFRLSEADAGDVAQTVWLRLVEQLPALRTAAALPGWLATTTRRECIKVSKASGRVSGSFEMALLQTPADEETTALDADLLATERRAMVREAFAQLPDHCQRLLALLVDPDPPPYADIGRQLGMPVGSIGPTRARCLSKLRESPVLAPLTSPVQESSRGERHV